MDELSLPRVIALTAFGGTYLGLALGRLPIFRVDRTGIAIIGGAVMVVSGVLPWDQAVADVDAPILVLLFGMMGWAAAAGLYRPAVLTAVTAVLSNLVSNVPAALLFKAVIPTFGEPVRAWLLLAMASTLAGNLTTVGSVANLIVVEQARGAGVRIGFLEYCRVGVPVTLLTLLVGGLLLVLLPA